MDYNTLSDKIYWHGYSDFYCEKLPQSITGMIVEFGVAQGASIRWLIERYPAARIVGADILSEQDNWPKNERISYARVDQNAEEDVASFLQSLESPSLIIEDGSHVPTHQSRCLKLGFAALKEGGIYILEDIQTSLPEHPFYQMEHKNQSRFFSFGKKKAMPTSLSILLAFDHMKRLKKAELSPEECNQLAGDGYLSSKDIKCLYSAINTVSFYKRCTLPTACYACKSKKFDYNSLTCNCGTPLFEHADSMTVLLTKN